MRRRGLGRNFAASRRRRHAAGFMSPGPGTPSLPGRPDQDFFLRPPFFFFGTFLPFLRASDRPMAMACLRLFTLPPLPPLPLLSLPLFCFLTAFFTSLRALLEYFRAMVPPWFVRQRTRPRMVPKAKPRLGHGVAIVRSSA